MDSGFKSLPMISVIRAIMLKPWVKQPLRQGTWRKNESASVCFAQAAQLFLLESSFVQESPEDLRELRMLLIGDDLAVTMGQQRQTLKQFLSEFWATFCIGFCKAAPLDGSVAAT